MTDRRLLAQTYAREHGEDPADIRDWTWPVNRPTPRSRHAG
jgi:xylulose-5-phosphate/fructose-6-phosphate phosphoketolase